MPCLLFFPVLGNAQSQKALQEPVISENSQQNPFDFALQAVENAEQITRQTGSAKVQRLKQYNLSVQKNSQKKQSNALQFRKKFNGTPAQSQHLYKALVAQYGEPKSIRGQSRVWDIQNPHKGQNQADIITIILKMEQNGAYELVMDRDRGADGRATWAAPRIAPTPKPSKAQKAKQRQAILQPDND